MGEGWWCEAESPIQGQMKSHIFPGVILAEAISMAHYGILHQLEISTKFLRAVVVLHFCLLEIYKNLGLPLSTITYIQYEIRFFVKILFKVCFLYSNLI